uniref:Ovule protein n=1 Tax=Heterorhabditis bacteriophora TaxID=37862 RepID=A0A1I7WCC7_HETBA
MTISVEMIGCNNSLMEMIISHVLIVLVTYHLLMYRFICYDHFDADQFETTPHRSLILKKGAVPSHYISSSFQRDKHKVYTIPVPKMRKVTRVRPFIIVLPLLFAISPSIFIFIL